LLDGYDERAADEPIERPYQRLPILPEKKERAPTLFLLKQRHENSKECDETTGHFLINFASTGVIQKHHAYLKLFLVSYRGETAEVSTV